MLKKKVVSKVDLRNFSRDHHFTLLTFFNSLFQTTKFLNYLIGVEKLRAAERQAKNSRVRLWKDYQPPTLTYSGKEKDFTGTVFEVINGDAVSVKGPSGQLKKVFLSSIRPPREAGK